MTRMSILALAVAAALTPAGAMTLSISDFKDGTTLPEAHAYPRCGGQNISPALAWSGAPKGTQSFVLTVIDGSVKPHGWSHWIAVDLAPTTASLPRGAQTAPAPAKGVQSNFGEAKYDGPCPPRGTGVHRYEFTIWAMPQATTAIAPDAKADVVKAMLMKTALDHATVVGTVAAR
jgi:Raf kinase inhibitor-like YbhB/YbcL family protein